MNYLNKKKLIKKVNNYVNFGMILEFDIDLIN